MTEGEVSHFEVHNYTDWPYQLTKKNSLQYLLRIPDLDQKSIQAILAFKDARIERVELTPEPIVGETGFLFTVKSENIEAFDYLTDDPSRLIVDFYVDPKKTVAIDTLPEKSTSKDSPQPATSAKTGKAEKKNLSQKKGEQKRKPASEFILVPTEESFAEAQKMGMAKVNLEQTSVPLPPIEIRGVYDGGDPDYKRFHIADFEIDERAIAEAKKNLYLPFPLIDYGFEPLAALERIPPKYIIEPSESAENKEARLALTIFENKRPAAFFTAAELFEKKYPKSRYKQVMHFLKADNFYERWQKDKNVEDFEQAMLLYQNLLVKYPDSPLVPRTKRLMAYAYLQRGDYLTALRRLEELIRLETDSKDRQELKIAQAFSLIKLHRYDEARTLLKEVEDATSVTTEKGYAAALIGNAFYKENKREAALGAYKRAVDYGPEVRNTIGMALFNEGEALFWEGRYTESLATLREYMQRFPDPASASYAMTRVGEILQILGAPTQRSLGALKECMFRFNGEPGAAIAEIKILTDRIPEMKEKEIETATSQVKALEKKIGIPEVDSYVALLLTDGYFKRGDFQKATNLLIEYFQNNPRMAHQDLLSLRIAKFITFQIKDAVEKQKNFDALKIYGKYTDTWLKKSDRLDTLYFVGKAYENLGAPEKALPYYTKLVAQADLFSNKPLAENPHALEALPSLAEMRLRLAQSQFAAKDFGNSAKNVDLIRSQEKDLDGQTRQELYLLGAKLEGEKGNFQQAEANLNRILQEFKPSQSTQAGVLLARSEVFEKQKKWKEALKDLENALANEELGKSQKFIALERAAKLYERQGQNKEAIITLQSVLDQYETEKDLSSTRYQLGNLLSKEKKYEEAEAVWKPLIAKKNMWSNLAVERQKEANWEKDYKKYVDRIPAMEGAQKEKK